MKKKVLGSMAVLLVCAVIGTPAFAQFPAASSKVPIAPTGPAPGAGSSKVWVNDSTKVYHCPTDKLYGHTKKGRYMTESEAKAKGFRADHGKACH